MTLQANQRSDSVDKVPAILIQLPVLNDAFVIFVMKHTCDMRIS